MEAVKVQDIAVNDLPWKIDYNAERCTMCGSCVASCTFRAIKVEVQRKSVVMSESNQPEPLRHRLAIPVIKQVADVNNACRGCGMCERVCPNNAIRAVRNPDNRRNLLFNRPIKRGGRTSMRNGRWTKSSSGGYRK